MMTDVGAETGHSCALIPNHIINHSEVLTDQYSHDVPASITLHGFDLKADLLPRCE